MSKSGEEEDLEECFHDSLDRLLSSSNTSCSSSPYSSSSESEDPNHLVPNPDDSVSVRVPGFPLGVSTNYDVWISEPSSVQERRLRLLHQMGLASDPSFVRHQSPERPTESPGSVSSEQLNNEKPGESIDRCKKSNVQKSSSGGLCGSLNEFDNISVSGIIRSKSDGDCKSTIELSNGVGVVHNNQNYNKIHNFAPDGFVNGVQIGNGNGSLNKPPKWRVKTYSKDSECRGLGNGKVKEVLEGDDLHKSGDPGSPVCTIKNLDTGKQFVVNEVREDGMWNKLKEVGTGQQLTMEEFEMCVGTSPIVQELMRRQGVEEGNRISGDAVAEGRDGNGSKVKKRGSWLKSLRNVASSVTRSKEGRSSDERDTSSEKGARRSSSATDESQEASFPEPQKVRVRQSGKSSKELTAMYRTQEIQAHKGSIWTIKFSLDGKYLATAGEDCIIHVWQVVESERKGDLLTNKPEDMNVNIASVANGSPEPISVSPNVDGQPERRRRGRSSANRKYAQVRFPEKVFALSEKPFCSFQGHLADVLDLSWSKSQHLLSSSMDKTVRLWHLSSKSCLKTFSHSDYVTSIHFNPVDDRYFLSGSLDAKVRIWSIPERKVVDWNDLHEMVTAACYTPDGQGALVGSYKGSCHLYDTGDNKLQHRSLINLRSKKKSQKKITGFQFAPGSTLEVLITSADSRIRVVDGTEMVHKFKGLRNTNSQISASFTTNGKYVVSASEDSHVYVWRHEGDSRPSRSKGVTVTQAYESFLCRDVSAAIPWPGVCEPGGSQYSSSREHNFLVNEVDEMSAFNHPLTSVQETNGSESSPCASGSGHGSPLREKISSSAISFFFDRSSATWPEEELALAVKNRAARVGGDYSTEETKTAWGMVIVTAGLKGDIRTFQNFGLPH